MIIATANTHFGRMVKSLNGFAPVAQAHILLLQEVYDTDIITLQERLKKAGFTLVHNVPHFGLAIALHNKSGLQFIPGSARKYTLAKMGRVERMIIKNAIDCSPDHLERGVISCELRTNGGRHVTIANVHPTTPIGIPLRARHTQIAKLTRLIVTRYLDRCFVIGGDMNHYPRPRKIDKRLHLLAKLTPVQIRNESTWRARGSEQESFFRVVALLRGKPLDHFDGQHDIILYNDSYLQEYSSTVTDIDSDHRAIITTFSFTLL